MGPRNGAIGMNGPLAVFGAAPTGERMERIRRSPQYRDGAFQNPVPSALITPGLFWNSLRRQFSGREQRVPPGALPIVTLTAADFAVPPASGLSVTWLGHSTVLLEIDGYRVLIDPVWGQRVSPFQLVGPRRFHPPPLPLRELPRLDAVILTHDHYDHLDMAAVQAIAASPEQLHTQWITALGVGAHLEAWGIPGSRITELDWGDSAHIGSLSITARPARHFSGRAIKRNQTLWASWVIVGPEHRVFHSGDTGFFDGLAAIGERHGPFDLTMIKIGAYDGTWPDIHLDPEEAVRVHAMLRGALLLPLHWGTFNLAFHAWDEPPERLLAAAGRENVRTLIPRPGERVEPADPPSPDAWWRRVSS